MNNLFGIIYFIHDDIGKEFQLNTLPNILTAEFREDVKVILIHNKRKQLKNLIGKETVTYSTEVHLVDQGQKFSLLQKTLAWPEAFQFAFDFLVRQKGCKKLGLITLSHSGGFVINRNREKLPISDNATKMKYFLKRLQRRTSLEDIRYLAKKTKPDTLFFTTSTILDTISFVEDGNNSGPIFNTKYSRKISASYCRKYEGLFIFQLSKFLKENNIKFEFIIFNNCDFQFYDNGYLIAPITEFFMGSQSYNNRGFWDFPTIIRSIGNTTEGITNISQKIFENCMIKWNEGRTEKVKYYFLVYTIHFDSLHKNFEKIIEAIIYKVKTDSKYKLGLLKWLRETSGTSGNRKNPFYDLVRFFDHANVKAKDSFIDELNQFKEVLKTNVIRNASVPDPLHCGFSIYLPRDKKQFNHIKGGLCNYFNPSDANDFSLNSKYDQLLIELFQ